MGIIARCDLWLVARRFRRFISVGLQQLAERMSQVID
jgi:hypothetical protein